MWFIGIGTVMLCQLLTNSKYTEDVRVLVQVNSVGAGHVNNVFFPNI